MDSAAVAPAVRIGVRGVLDRARAGRVTTIVRDNERYVVVDASCSARRWADYCRRGRTWSPSRRLVREHAWRGVPWRRSDLREAVAPTIDRMTSIAAALDRLTCSAHDGRLASLCQRFGLDLFVVFGSAAHEDSGQAEPADLDVAARFASYDHTQVLPCSTPSPSSLASTRST